jgi:hypothetical protein
MAYVMDVLPDGRLVVAPWFAVAFLNPYRVKVYATRQEAEIATRKQEAAIADT